MMNLLTMGVLKRLLILFLLFGVVTSASAQRWTIWYGANYSGEMKSIEPYYQWRFANAGVDYTIPVSRWDFTVGAGLNTKGAFHRLNYAQLEGNVGFRFIDTPQGFRVSALTGPCFGIRVADDLGEVPAIMEARPTIFGWQGGISMKYKFLALKVGYEHPLSGYWVSDIFERIGEPIIGYRLMTTAKPQSLFIRLGITF